MNPRSETWQKEESRILLRDVVFLGLVLFLSIIIAETWLVSESQPATVDRIVSYILVFIPLGTLNFIGHYYYRNFRIKRTGNLRSSLRYRLMIAFMIIAVIPSIPIFLVTGDRIDKVMRSMMEMDLKSAVLSADQMLMYHEESMWQKYDQSSARRVELNGINVIPESGETIYIRKNDRIIQKKGELNISIQELKEFYTKDRFASHLFIKEGVRYLITEHNTDTYIFTFIKNIYDKAGVSTGEFSEASRLLKTQKTADIAEEVPQRLRLIIALIYVFMIFLALVVAIVLSRQISNPIVSLAAATRSVTEGHLDIRIDERLEGEIGILIDSFNSMTEELQTLRSRLMHSMRVAAWQEVARRLAHEIKNPLTPIQLSAERMLRRLDHPEKGGIEPIVLSGANTIIDQVAVLKQMVEEFSNFARLPGVRLELLSLKPIIEEVALLFESENVAISTEIPDDLPQVKLDKNLFTGMLNNLLRNSIDAMKGIGSDIITENPEISITLRRHRQAGRQYVLFIFEDNGPGIEEDLKDRIFEPYFTTKGNQGSGLGMAVVERAVTEHNARIYVSRSRTGGAEFRIFFPI